VGGQTSSGILFFLIVAFLGWWWWPTLEPEAPALAERARSAVLRALGRSAPEPEVAGLTVATAASPVPTPRPTATPEPQPVAAPFCQPGEEPTFRFGFATLKQQVGAPMGSPLECEHTNPDNGDALQATTTGLAAYDKATNTPRFTDGWRTWALTERGLLSWEGPTPPPELSAGRPGR
jgi:hypothetical protein